MNPLEPHTPRQRPLLWPDFVFDLQDRLLDTSTHPVHIVGGAVRDALLHRPIKDIDLATPSGAIKLARQIANLYQGDIFVMDRERDVARVFLDTQDGPLMLDVAGYRGEDLLVDLQERDFTINAMAVDLMGDLSQLIDPLDAELDLLGKQLRQCNSEALIADPIRALRAVRQSVQLQFRIEAGTLRDVREHGLRLVETSPERVRDEFFNLLKLQRVSAGLRVLHSTGLLTLIVPEVSRFADVSLPAPMDMNVWESTLKTVEKLSALLTAISYKRTDETAAVFDLGMMVMQFDRYRKALNEHVAHMWPNHRPHRSILLLAALLHHMEYAYVEMDRESVDAALENRLESLRLSVQEKRRVTTIVTQHRNFLEQSNWDELEQHRFWHRLGDQGLDVILLSLASFLGQHNYRLNQHAWLAMVDRARTLLAARYDLYEQIVAPPPLVNGDSLMQELGLERGRLVGVLLDLIREAQVTGEVKSEEDALRLAHAYLHQDNASSSGSSPDASSS